MYKLITAKYSKGMLLLDEKLTSIKENQKVKILIVSDDKIDDKKEIFLIL